jgi:hypothetical protein
VINFWLASRPKPGADRDLFDYEWGILHVSLMLSTPSVMAGFIKYAQHRTPDGLPEEAYPYGPHEKEWYAMSNHVLPDLGALERIFGGQDYPRRMTPHSFGDKEFTIELTRVAADHSFGRTLAPGVGVKVVNFLAAARGVDQTVFEQRAEAYTSAIVRLGDDGQDLRRYVLNLQLPLDASMFTGTLFEVGGVQTYAAVEELWFPDIESALAFQTRRVQDQAATTAAEELIDGEQSFSMVVVERVVWDYSVAGAPPRPAVESATSVEAVTLTTERAWGKWNTIATEDAR